MQRLILLIIILALGNAAYIVADGLLDDAQISDVGVVPGSKVMPDGTPSARLQARLDEAAERYRQGLFKHVIVSGGKGVEGFSEAKVMADYLEQKQSVPRAAILLDEQGNTTEATARNSAAIMKEHGFTSALVITQYFHITRSRYALRRAGIEEVHTAHAHYVEMRDIYSTLREVVAMPVYWFGAK